MANRRYFCKCWTSIVASIKVTSQEVEKDKYGVKLKFPNRTCKYCKKYPCFIGIEKCVSNFAAYGCTYYSAKI